MSQTAFYVEPVPPFRLDLTVWTLRRRPDNVVDRWDGETYRRVLPTPKGFVEVAARQVAPPQRPKIQISVSGQPLGPQVKSAVTSSLERLLGLRIDLGPFYQLSSHHKKLDHLVRPFQGMKPPRFATIFEGLLNGIACQQVTLTLGIQLLNRLAIQYGGAPDSGDAPGHAFPQPEDLAGLSPNDLRHLGFSRQKGRAMIELSQSILEGSLHLEELTKLPEDEAKRNLQALRGVGRWTAEYVLLRGFGRTDVFPGDDVGGRNNLQRWLGLATPPDYEGIQQALSPYKPYAGLIYFHMLLDRLAEAGVVQTASS